MIKKYLVYGVRLESNVAFPEFTPGAFEQRDMTLQREDWAAGGLGDLPGASVKIESYYHRPTGGAGTFHYYTSPTHFVARWHELCDFQVSQDGSQINCYPWAGAHWSDIKPFLLGRIIPLALNLRQVLTFHGGGVLSPQGTVGLIARSGMGKSTMVSSLACSGWPLITDDVLAVREEAEGFSALAGPSVVRLTPEALGHLHSQYSLSATPRPDYDKSSIHLREGGLSAAAQPLLAIYFLRRVASRPVEGVTIHHVTPKEALPLLTKYISNRKFLELPHITQYFGALTRLVSRVPVKILEYPSGLEDLPGVCQRLRDDCRLQEETALPGSRVYRSL